MNKVFNNPPIEEIKKLLVANGLTIDDLAEPSAIRFYGVGHPNSVQGVVGLEIHGRFGLLRSLAVSKAVQGMGLASALIKTLESDALEVGITDLYLLTETAENYFLHRGFSSIAREVAPTDIRVTRQFSTLCPDSATLMHKCL